MMIKQFSISYKIAGLNLVVFLVLCGAIIYIGSQALDSEEMRQQATERQELNIRIAWEILNTYGNDFYIRDGSLYAGVHQLNGDYQIVDRVKQLVGGTATIFMHDTRVTTNVMKEDGTRAIGTKLGEGPVNDAIFKRGESYRGGAINGRPVCPRAARVITARIMVAKAPVVNACIHAAPNIAPLRRNSPFKARPMMTQAYPMCSIQTIASPRPRRVCQRARRTA